ncbi:DNA-binding protein [Streptomyces violaceorubidus]
MIGRVAVSYGLETSSLRPGWKWRSQQPRHESGAPRADAEVLFNAGGRRLLAQLCGVDEHVLARALPSWNLEDARLPAEQDEAPAAVWRIGGAVAGPVAYGCRLCTVRRTGADLPVVRYMPLWFRVCIRHGRWLLDAEADQPFEYLDVRNLPEVAAAQRRWAGVARRAVRAGAGAGPEQVFALAGAVVSRWWDQALGWERETVWPRRLHQVAGGDAGPEFEWWRIVGRDTVVFPEVVAVAEALLDPAMAELVWMDSGGERPRLLPADGLFCRRLGERVGREWLGPLAAADHGGPLIAWMGGIVRRRRTAGRPLVPGYADDPWWVRREHQPVSMAGQLRVLGKEKRAPGSGRMWRSTVSAEQRMLITETIETAEEQLLQLRGVQTGPTADVARRLLRGLGHSAGLIENAWKRTAVAAVNGGVPLEEVAQWVDMPVEVLQKMLMTSGGREDSG